MRKTGETHQTQLLQTFFSPRSHGVKAQGGGLNDFTTHSYNWSRSFRCGYWVAIQKRKRRTERCVFVETTPSGIQKVRGDLQSLLTTESGAQFVLVLGRGDGKKVALFPWNRLYRNFPDRRFKSPSPTTSITGTPVSKRSIQLVSWYANHSP